MVAIRVRVMLSLRADAREEQGRREEHDPEDVVRAPLDVPARLGREPVRGRFEPVRFLVRREPVLGELERVSGASGVVRGRVATQASNAGLNSSRNRAR